MSISKDPLGMNARNFLYVNRYNRGGAKMRADDKVETKKILLAQDIPTAKILHIFVSRSSIKDYTWQLPQEGFVIKPSRGYGGEGILVFNNWNGKTATTIGGKTYTIQQIKSHIFDIFEGIYSLQYVPDIAYIEERIKPNSFFKKLTPLGLPDIRVIVFNKIPIMAMLRTPTYKSGGKANLHQGGIGIGIDMRTGITNFAYSKGKLVKKIPASKIKTAGIRIPQWDDILALAARTQVATRLGYAGVDIVVDRDHGPVVVEVNARPGLSIQNANQASLRFRLETVENLKVSTIERGVEIAKSLFAEDFADKVSSEIKVLSIVEPITISNNGLIKQYNAKLDTGAYRTSLDYSVVKEMNLQILPQKFWAVSANGRQEREAVKLNYNLAGKRVTTTATVAKRTHLRFPIIIGRRDLRGFYVDPNLSAQKEVEIFGENQDSEELIQEEV